MTATTMHCTVDSGDDGDDYADVTTLSPLDLLEYANSYALVIDMPGLDLSVKLKADDGDDYTDVTTTLSPLDLFNYGNSYALVIDLPGLDLSVKLKADDGDDYADVTTLSPLDLFEYANSYALVIDMPGLNLSVMLKADDLLLIRERWRMGKFTRKFAQLPENPVSRNGVTVEKLPNTVEVGIDRLSLLPDDLLVSVLSLLSLKEATATSILSGRWRYLHTIRAKLDFDGWKVLRECNFQVLGEVRRKCVRWVDEVVRLNQISRLEKFRVALYLRESDTQHIDNWIRFALSRKVESLELIMSTYNYMYMHRKEELYTLDLHKFNHDDLKLMRKLSTHLVSVSGEAVEMLLRSCPHLEHVSIAKSPTLLDLEIIKPFPSLKSIEISNCSNLSSVVVGDSNIESFKYHGERLNKFVLVNVPLLTEIWMYGTCTERLQEDVVEMFSTVLPQLHTFKICASELPAYCPKFCSVVEMCSLKQLVVDIGLLRDDYNLLRLIEFIRACPRLQRFVIEEPYDKRRLPNKYVEVKPMEIQMDTSAHKRIGRASHDLKEVMFVGYRGVNNHYKLLKHLVEYAVALETIVIDPWGFKYSPFTNSFDPIPRRKYHDEDQLFARAYALKECVPLRINVIIL